MSFDLYQQVTDQIIAMLDKGVVPWRSPILGRGTAGHPKNLESTKPYRGVNVFLLAFTAHVKGYGSSYWLTFNQAKARGGSVQPPFLTPPGCIDFEDMGISQTV